MPRSNDQSDLTPEQRVRELARIFAAGVLRLRRRHLAGRAGFSPHEKTQNSLAEGLEVSPDTVLSVTNPVNGPESPNNGAPA